MKTYFVELGARQIKCESLDETSNVYEKVTADGSNALPYYIEDGKIFHAFTEEEIDNEDLL